MKALLYFFTVRYEMKTLQTSLNGYHPATQATDDFKAVLHLSVNKEPNKEMRPVLKDYKKTCSKTPLLLYCDELIRGRTVLYRVLRDYLVLKHFHHERHPTTNKIMFGLVHCFLSEKDLEYAFKRLSNLRESGDSPQVINFLSGNPQNIAGRSLDNQKKLLTICLNDSWKDERFSGKLVENAQDYLNTDEEPCLDYNFSTEQNWDLSLSY